MSWLDLNTERKDLPIVTIQYTDDTSVENGVFRSFTSSTYSSSSKNIGNGKNYKRTITVDISECTEQKKNQIRKLNSIITESKAYAIFHHRRAIRWFRVYWIGGFVTIALSGSLSIVNASLDPNSGSYTVKILNTVTTALISIILGIFSFLDPTNRRILREIAGDNYLQLSEDITKDLFLKNRPVSTINTEKLLDRYMVRFNDYLEAYYQPIESELKDIMEKIVEKNEIELIV